MGAPQHFEAQLHVSKEGIRGGRCVSCDSSVGPPLEAREVFTSPPPARCCNMSLEGETTKPAAPLSCMPAVLGGQGGQILGRGHPAGLGREGRRIFGGTWARLDDVSMQFLQKLFPMLAADNRHITFGGDAKQIWNDVGMYSPSALGTGQT